MQFYPGTDPCNIGPWATMTFTPGFGIFPTPDCMADGDARNAQNLMSAAQAARDNINLLTNRLVHLNVIEGSAGNSAWTAQINNWNGWAFNGAQISFNGTTVLVDAQAYVINGHTLQIGHSTLGVGKILVDGQLAGAGSEIRLINGADLRVNGANALISAENGTEILVDNTSFLQVVHVLAPSTDPGANNRIYSNNIAKSAGHFHTDGAGAVVADDGYNYTVAFIGTNVRITFVRPMASALYMVTRHAQDKTNPLVVYACGAFNRTANRFDLAVTSVAISPAAVDLTAVAVEFDFMVMTVQ